MLPYFLVVHAIKLLLIFLLLILLVLLLPSFSPSSSTCSFFFTYLFGSSPQDSFLALFLVRSLCTGDGGSLLSGPVREHVARVAHA